jgi:hypothetical protein
MADVLPKWERDGFASAPETFTAEGAELVLRAYSPSPTDLDYKHGTSVRIGNCFFVPACGHRTGRIAGFSIDRRKWTGAFLEERLNAFFWGNAYDRIGIWALNPGTSYNIGLIGQSTRYDLADRGGTGRYLDWPASDQYYFRQVTLNLPSGTTKDSRDRIIESLIRPIADFGVVNPLSLHHGHA